MDSYCCKCQSKTPSHEGQLVETPNKKWRLKAKCAVCNQMKSKFIKNPDEEVLVQAIEVHRPVVKRFPKRRIVTRGIDELWAADLVIMNRYASENDGYKYMLNIVDTFSKYAWSEPLKTKSGQEVAYALRSIIKRAKSTGHKPPDLLHTDKGREFVNKDFKQLLKEHDIKMYHTENEEKSAIVERFNRTLNNKMKVHFETSKSFRWVDILQSLLRQYNFTVHRTIKMKPMDVDKTKESYLQSLYAGYNQTQSGKPKLKIGDRVRITIKKDTFSNKYRRNWTREVFTIVGVLNTVPITYRIADEAGEEIVGSFYERELQKSML